MSEQEQYQQIEDFIHQRLDPQREADFRQRLAHNAELRAEVALHREMMDAFADGPENDLRRSLAGIGAEFGEDDEDTDRRRGFSWWYLLPALLVLIPLVYFLLPGETVVTNVAPVDAPNIIGDSLKFSDPVKPPDTPSTPPDKGEVITPPIAERPDPPAPPILADFSRNPALDFYTDNPLRSDDLVWSALVFPETTIAKTYRATLRVEGDGTPGTGQFQAHLFSNRPADFDNFAPLQTVPLVFTQNGNGFNATLAIDLPERGRRYYLVVEEIATEGIVWVGSFRGE